MSSTLSPCPERLATPPGWIEAPGESQLHLAHEPTVLVVDDDPDVAPLVAAALGPFHIRTDSAASGAEALARLCQCTYDLVVLDLVMADLHGFDVLRHLRAHPRFKAIRVLILTANWSHEALARSFGYGADDFVTKPFDLHELGIRAFRLIRPFSRD
jgi:DNA-binding response OmpR family regulator